MRSLFKSTLFGSARSQKAASFLGKSCAVAALISAAVAADYSLDESWKREHPGEVMKKEWSSVGGMLFVKRISAEQPENLRSKM